MTEKKQPPYAKYAFANPYNLALVGGVASAAMLTGDWWLGLVAGGAELIWMMFAPDSKLLRRFWFDKQFESEEAARRAAELQAKFLKLPSESARRCTDLIAQHAVIDKLAKENPVFTAELLKGELGKLENLVNSFVELSVTAARYDEYRATVNINEIEFDERRYRHAVEAAKDPEQRTLAQKNLSVVTARKEKFAEITRYLTRALGELELIENTFRLLADQIMTMQSPQELGGQLDELIDGVEAVKETTRETDKLLAAMER